ncbi:phage gp6-like head-tail connector protein [Actinoplanes sp. NBC_00393]|uniref:head-tail connector protein n=1 Tax=Actinoplanes sp. NBC_00393 TaxID=2975953 RepID=UPI002E2330B3
MARDWKTTYSASAAAAQHQATFTSAAVAGHGLVAIAAAPATIAVPGDWDEHIDPLGTGELSMASKVAAGGETSILWDRDPATSTAPRTMAAWVESRDDVGELVGTPAGYQHAVAVGGGLDFGDIVVPEDGCRIYVAVSQVDPGSAWTPVWSGATGEDVLTAAGHGFEAVRLAVASQAAATAGNYPISVSGLPEGAVCQAAVLILAPGEGGGEPPPAAETAVEAENRLTGTASSTWDVDGAGSTTIQGFATDTSFARGGTLSVKVHSPSSSWTGSIYRVGYYGGAGARLIDTISGPQTTQPDGTVDGTTLMASCANWSVNGTWSVPSDAPAGVYIMKIARTDNAALASHIGPFVVTNPSRKAAIAIKLSDSTWYAYNHAGTDPDDILAGRSIYGTGTAASFVFDQGTRAKAVSYDRPLVTREHLPQTSFWNAEYPLIRWLERLGYDLDYLSCAMVDADPTLLLGRDVVISSGHDEYWSAGMHDAFTGARDHATQSSHAIYLSGNEAFWRIRWDSSRRTYACWKDTHDGALNSSGLYSGTWQDTRSMNSDRRPPALLNGQRFRLNGISAYALGATSAHASSPLWRSTAVAALTGSQTWSSPVGIVGFEADEPADTSATERPDGLIRLSQVSYAVTDMLADDNGNIYTLDGTYTHAITAYRSTVTGAAVFGFGTVQYAWGLDETHDRHPGGVLVSTPLQQALTNLLADLGSVPPAYPFPSGLVLPTAVALSTYGLPDPVDPDPEATPVYTDLATVKAMLGKTTADDRDDLIEAAIAAASRMIDERCGRAFYLEATATARTFPARDRSWLDGDAQSIRVDDIGDATGLTVETKVGFSGTWSSVTGFEPGPDNADLRGRPWTEVVYAAGWLTDNTKVRITARWGWPTVPDGVAQAAALLAARLYRRKDSPQGVLGSADWGVIRVSRFDPDVEALVAPYILMTA